MKAKLKIEKTLELLIKFFSPEATHIPKTAKETTAKIVIFGREIGS